MKDQLPAQNFPNHLLEYRGLSLDSPIIPLKPEQITAAIIRKTITEPFHMCSASIMNAEMFSNHPGFVGVTYGEISNAIKENRKRLNPIIPVPMQSEWSKEFIDFWSQLNVQSYMDGNCGACWPATVFSVINYLGKSNKVYKNIWAFFERESYIHEIERGERVATFDKRYKDYIRYRNLFCSSSDMLLQMIKKFNKSEEGLAISLIHNFPQYGYLTHWFYCPATLWADFKELPELLSQRSIKEIIKERTEKTNGNQSLYVLLIGDTSTLGTVFESPAVLVPVYRLATEIVRASYEECELKDPDISKRLGMNDQLPRKNVSVIRLFK